MGGCALPVNMGYINTVFTSQYNSFKFSGIANEIGYTTSDRTAAVSGKITDEKDRVGWIPATFRVAATKPSPGEKPEYKTFKVEVVDHEFFAPVLLDYAFYNIATSYAQAFDGYTICMTSKIKFKGYDEIVLHNASSSREAPSRYFYFESPPLYAGAVMDNPFKELELESLDVTIDFSSEMKAADIIEVKADKEHAEPGEEVVLTLKLDSWRRDEWAETIKVRIPEKIEDDYFVMTVNGGSNALYDFWFDAFPSVEDAIVALNEATRQNGIYVTTQAPSRRMLYKGRHYEKLPPSIIEQLRRTAPDKISTNTKSMVIRKKETEWVLSGRHTIRIRIDRKEK